MNILRSEIPEHRAHAVQGFSRPVDPNQKERQNEARFCIYCCTNGQTPSWCHEKIRDEEMNRLEHERTAVKKVPFSQDFRRKLGPSYGSEQWARGQNFQRRNQNYTNNRPTRNPSPAYQNFSPKSNFAYGNHHPNNGKSYYQRPNQPFSRNDENTSRNGPFSNQNGNWRNNGGFPRSAQRRDFSRNSCRAG